MTIRAVILSVAIAAGFVAQAEAQDRWAGTYAGLSMSSAASGTRLKGLSGERHETDAARLGVYAGHNFARSGSGFVWGPEVSLSTHGSGKTEVRHGVSSKENKGYLLDARVRAGYATDRAFFYASTGLALTNGAVTPSGGKGKKVEFGTSLGLGAEVAIDDAWSARLDVSGTGFGGKKKRFNGRKREVETGLGRITLGVSRKF